jgi:hypothetical protein
MNSFNPTNPLDGLTGCTALSACDCTHWLFQVRDGSSLSSCLCPLAISRFTTEAPPVCACARSRCQGSQWNLLTFMLAPPCNFKVHEGSSLHLLLRPLAISRFTTKLLAFALAPACNFKVRNGSSLRLCLRPSQFQSSQWKLLMFALALACNFEVRGRSSSRLCSR